MAILGRDGQLIANASQRTIVMENLEEFETFRSNLPEGVNIYEAFDIYIRESGEVYAAGTPFKLRETSDAPVELHVSTTGTGDGTSAEDALPATQLAQKLATLAAHYDFNNQPLTVYLAPGVYKPIMLFMEFLNCTNLTFMPEEGFEQPVVDVGGGGTKPEKPPEEHVLDATKTAILSVVSGGAFWSGACFTSNISTPITLQGLGFVVGDEAVRARKGQVAIMDCAYQMTGHNPLNPGYYGILHADGGDIMVLTTYGIINRLFLDDNDEDDNPRFIPAAMFLADYGGKISFSVRNDIFKSNIKTQLDSETYTIFDGESAIFMASDLGTVKLYGIPNQTALLQAIDSYSYQRWAQMTQAGWYVVKRNGIMYLPLTDGFTAVSMGNCDNTSSVIKEGQE